MIYSIILIIFAQIHRGTLQNITKPPLQCQSCDEKGTCVDVTCKSATQCYLVMKQGGLLQHGCLSEGEIDEEECTNINKYLGSIENVTESQNYCYLCQTNLCNILEKVNWTAFPEGVPRRTPRQCYSCNSTDPDNCNVEREYCDIKIHTCYIWIEEKRFQQGCRRKGLFSDAKCTKLAEDQAVAYCEVCLEEVDDDVRGCNLLSDDLKQMYVTEAPSTTTTRKPRSKAPIIRCYSCSGSNCDSRYDWKQVDCMPKEKCYTMKKGETHKKKCAPLNQTCSDDAESCVVCESSLCNNATHNSHFFGGVILISVFFILAIC